MKHQENTSRKLLVFLCHGSEGKTKIRELYSDLREDGADPWLDEKNIIPGQDWDMEIKKAVKKSDAILVYLSASSINKEGYVQKEIKFALDAADEKPEGTIFVIPVKLEECDVPFRRSQWHWVNVFDKGGYENILRALRSRAENLKLSNLPGDGFVEFFEKPIEKSSGRMVYKSGNVREIMKLAKDGQISTGDVHLLSTDEVVGITFEAMTEILSPFSTENRRLQEKEFILRLVGIQDPYLEWQEKNAKIHCFRNETDRNVSSSEIEMIRVRSSNIAAIGYDQKRELLRIAFLSGAVYEYYGVPEHLYDGIMSADSHGRFLNAYIKVPEFSYKQIR